MTDQNWGARLHQAGAYSLYLHIPFCAQKCSYCDFASWATRRGDPLMAKYAGALARQVREASDAGLLDNVRTAYLGGGTPSLMGPDALGSLIGCAAVLGVGELSFEANPDSLSDEVLTCAVEAGATRVSIGVQSLSDPELIQLGRLHDASCAVDRVRAAAASGLDVSCDLMCAIPLQSDGSWDRTLSQFLELGAGHVSVYPLMIEEGTLFEKRFDDSDCSWNSDEVQAARMEKARVKLEGNEFKRYEVASYAKPNHVCHHNIAYWTGRSYLGLGTRASSMLTLEGYLRLSKVISSLPAPTSEASRVRLTVKNGREEIVRDPQLAALRFDIEFLTEEQTAAEDLMLGARLADGLDPSLVAHARRVLPGGALDECLDGLVRDGYIKNCSGRYLPTERGWLLGNELYGRLWGLAPGEVAEA